jgi:hypothetical protein
MKADIRHERRQADGQADMRVGRSKGRTAIYLIMQPNLSVSGRSAHRIESGMDRRLTRTQDPLQRLDVGDGVAKNLHFG